MSGDNPQNDSLAWLTKEKDLDKSRRQQGVQPRSRTRRGSARRNIEQVAKEKTEVALLEDSFAAITPQGEELAARFYQRLFEHYPIVTPHVLWVLND